MDQMTFLVPVMLFGWIPISVIIFHRLKPHHAVLVVLIGGVLFLPTATYNISGFPDYSKATAIGLGLILGGRLSGSRKAAVGFQYKLYDIPVALFCLSSLMSSLTNHLGPYDGFSRVLDNIFFLAVPYMAGRVYFSSIDHLRDLCHGIITGGLLYVPMCLFEVRMSPQLNYIFYGFLSHSFLQHVRYGGYRPMVFMSHGLKVALWMALSSVVAFWLWRAGKIKHFKGLPMLLVVGAMIGTTILCKSANGWLVVTVGCLFFFLYSFSPQPNKIVLVFLLLVAAYPALRITSMVSIDMVEGIAGVFFDSARVKSLGIRLWQEDLFIQKTLERPLLGWGGSTEGWPVRADGSLAVPMIDAMWLIFFNSKGLLGASSFFWAVLQGPWLSFRANRRTFSRSDDQYMLPVLLGLVVVFFMLDALFNGMPNPIYFMISGALVGYYDNHRKEHVERAG